MFGVYDISHCFDSKCQVLKHYLLSFLSPGGNFYVDVCFCLNCLMVAEKMSKAPDDDNAAEMQNSSMLTADDIEELHSASNSSRIEVPVGSLILQDSFIENQQDEEHTKSQRFMTEEVTGTENDATVTYQNVIGDANDCVSEKQLSVTERQEEQADEMVTNMSVHVRSGGQVAEQMSVACGEGAVNVSEDAENISSKADVTSASPVLRYSSDAAATGCMVLLEFLCQKIKLLN